MIPSNRNNPQVAPHAALSVDKHITVYVLLAGVAGGLVLAVVVMVCCKVCLRKKKPLTRQHVVFSRGSNRQQSRARKYHSLDSSVSVDIETSCGYPDSSPSSRESKDYDPEEVIESLPSQAWPPQVLPDSVPGHLNTDIELKEMNKGVSESKAVSHAISPEQITSQASSPEQPPEVTSAVRRRSSVGIQRQASVCLSDEEDQENIGAIAQKPPGLPKREITKVSAIIHHCGNDKPLAHSWDQKTIGLTSSQPTITTVSVRHPPFIHSHSSPDSRSTATMLESKQGRLFSTFSLHGVAADTLARVVDLEDYHYSRQQVWELASRGATLLKERSQSSLDVASGTDGWKEESSRIQQAESTEAGLLEKSLEQHQLEHLRSMLRRYSPVDEEDTRSWSKVRYNDTGSREDIRDEVIEIISGESEDDSNSSIESEMVKQQYRKLWKLRATLEEEVEELSDTQEKGEEILQAPLAQLEDCELFPSQTTSFESNVDIAVDDPIGDCDEGSCEHLQLPLHELRRHSYKSLLTKRLQKRTSSDPRSAGGSGGGGESSFESVESSSTDRTEGATTSFESTTDNTDSAGEGQTRLQQMKADSGYKSMESNGKAPRLSRKQLQFALDTDSLDAMLTLEGSLEEELSFETPEAQEKDEVKPKFSTDTAKQTSVESGIVGTDIPVIVETITENKKSKSALKKHHTEGDIQWSEQQILSDISTDTRGKTSVFQRFFRSGRLRVDQLQLYRDYSIDEKSDALFREFSRPDLHESEWYRNRSGRLHGHIRLHHRPLPPVESGSPRHARKVLSPQLSIEEESCELAEEHQSKAEEKQVSQHAVEDLRSPCETQAQIPVICLSQGRGERLT